MSESIEKEGLGPKYFTLTRMADALGVSKSYTSRRARSGKDVRGVPVDEYVQFKDGKIFGFEVPRESLDDAGNPVPEKGDFDSSSASRSRVGTGKDEEGGSRSRIKRPDHTEDVDQAADGTPDTESGTERTGTRDTNRSGLLQSLGVLGGSIILGMLLRSQSDA